VIEESGARVFFVEQMERFNIAAAKKFGDITYLFDRAPNPFNTVAFLAAVEQRFDDLKFNPKRDLIGVTGATVKVSLYVARAVSLYPATKLLLYNALYHDYQQRIVSWSDVEQEVRKRAVR